MIGSKAYVCGGKRYDGLSERCGAFKFVSFAYNFEKTRIDLQLTAAPPPSGSATVMIILLIPLMGGFVVFVANFGAYCVVLARCFCDLLAILAAVSSRLLGNRWRACLFLCATQLLARMARNSTSLVASRRRTPHPTASVMYRYLSQAGNFSKFLPPHVLPPALFRSYNGL